MKRQWLLSLVLACISLSGCASAKWWTENSWFGDQEEKLIYGKPTKIVAIWSNSVFNQPGESPTRGLGGRLYFYDENHRPVAVNGKLSVFLYDDSDPDASLKQEASKVIHFPAEDVARNYSPTEFGSSYSFWVPWDEVGGERTQLSVIPVFTSTDGLMLVGEQARHLLPGTMPESKPETGIAQVSNVTEIGKDNRQVKQMSAEMQASSPNAFVSTIKLPPSMQQRVSMAPPKRNSVYGSMSAAQRQKMLDRFRSLQEAAVQETLGTATDENKPAAKVYTMQNGKMERADKQPLQPKEQQPQSVRSGLGLRQAQASPSAPRASDPARLLRDPEASLFAR